MDARAAALVALGGAIGALARWWVSSAMRSETFPWGTLTVNLVGSLLLGAVMYLGGAGDRLDARWVQLIGVGCLGAFTTMSTYSVETMAMWERGDRGSAAAYILLTALVAPLLAWAGFVGARWGFGGTA